MATTSTTGALVIAFGFFVLAGLFFYLISRNTTRRRTHLDRRRSMADGSIQDNTDSPENQKKRAG